MSKIIRYEIKEETIFQEMDRFIDSIHDEIRSNDCNRSSIDFWLFKLKRRVKILKTASNIIEVCVFIGCHKKIKHSQYCETHSKLIKNI